MHDIKVLNSLHAIPGRLVFKRVDEGLVFAEVTNQFTTGRVYLQGGQVTHFQPKGQEPILWVSDRSLFQPGKAIRGGIPVCWPWFGDHPGDPEKPPHGFARTSAWEVLEAGETDHQEGFIRLGLKENEHTLALWPYSFNLELNAIFGKRLSISLHIKNCGGRTFSCSDALHSYFYVGDCGLVRIMGLEGKAYLDKTDGLRRKRQAGAVVMAGETDRIYLATAGGCFIEDPVLRRTISVNKRGSNNTVIWNPGPEKSGSMPDMAENGYRSMVCVETANAADDFITLFPGESHDTAAVIGIAS